MSYAPALRVQRQSQPAQDLRRLHSYNRADEIEQTARTVARGVMPPQLRMTTFNHPLEREANQVADRALSMPIYTRRRAQCCPSGNPAQENAQRQLIKAEGADEARIGAPNTNACTGHRVDVAPARSIPILRGGEGQPLEESTRSFFESRLGTDLSSVRVHAGPEAQALAHAINARAFTVGSHIYFAVGEYGPATQHGRRLLTHELIHVHQQVPVDACGRDSPPSKPLRHPVDERRIDPEDVSLPPENSGGPDASWSITHIRSPVIQCSNKHEQQIPKWLEVLPGIGTEVSLGWRGAGILVSTPLAALAKAMGLLSLVHPESDVPTRVLGGAQFVGAQAGLVAPAAEAMGAYRAAGALRVAAGVNTMLTLPALLAYMWGANLAEVKLAIKRDAFRRGVVLGLACQLHGMEWLWVRDRYWNYQAFPGIEERIIKAEGIKERGFNSGLVDGYEVGLRMSNEDRYILLGSIYTILAKDGFRVSSESELFSSNTMFAAARALARLWDVSPK